MLVARRYLLFIIHFIFQSSNSVWWNPFLLYLFSKCQTFPLLSKLYQLLCCNNFLRFCLRIFMSMSLIYCIIVYVILCYRWQMRSKFYWLKEFTQCNCVLEYMVLMTSPEAMYVAMFLFLHKICGYYTDPSISTNQRWLRPLVLSISYHKSKTTFSVHFELIFINFLINYLSWKSWLYTSIAWFWTFSDLLYITNTILLWLPHNFWYLEFGRVMWFRTSKIE